MAAILACIRASPLAPRPLRPLASIRWYCDKKDGDGTGTPPEEKETSSLDGILQKIKIHKPTAPIRLQSVKPPKTAPEKVPDLDARTTHIAEKAARTLPGDVQKNLDELLGQLKEVSRESRENLGDLLVGMKIDRSTGEPGASYPDPSSLQRGRGSERVFNLRDTDDNRMRSHRSRVGLWTGSRTPYDLFSGPRLGIFSGDPPKAESEIGCSLPIWDRLQKKELKLSFATSPRNGFEEMIRWTEEGKLWPFPINNEHGMLEEANVSFEDHVFLDHLIEDDNAFPPGPVKQFMELVCVGLSKNPYISVERKHQCIEWYRDYLTSKKKIIEATLQ